MIPSCLYFLFKKRMELEFLKECFSEKIVVTKEVGSHLRPESGSSKIICTKKKK